MPVLAAIVTTLVLQGGIFDSVQPAGGKLLVSGSTTGNACVWSTVDPSSLEAKQVRGSCARPLRSAQPAVPVVIPSSRSQWQAVRIAHVGPPFGYGPIVMRYQDASDTRPVSTYGPGALWLYDVDTERGAELLRFSPTGRLEQTVAMPKLYRPVIAADEDGLYLMAAVNGGVGGPGPAALYHVAPGAGSAVIIHREGRAALWITANAHTVWTEIISGTSHAALWRFDGPKARATRLWRKTIGTAPVATYGGGSLWAVTPTWAGRHSGQCKSENVSQIDPTTGREAVVATVATSGYCSLVLDPQGLTYSRGALYFLSGARLYRVRP